MLLKVGRHIRPRPHFKLIIGREEGENRFMEGYRKQFTYLVSKSHTGPLVLIDGKTSEADLELAARITARFGHGKQAEQVDVEANMPDGTSKLLRVKPLPSDDMDPAWYI